MMIRKNLTRRGKEAKGQRKEEGGGRGLSLAVALRRNAAFLFSVFCFLFFVRPVGAHGGGVLVVGNEPVGEYVVSVWVNPPVPHTNETLHMTVGIAGADQAPVMDADVEIDIFALDSGLLVTSATATTEQSVNRLFYETDFPKIEAGNFEVVVRVDGANGHGAVTFEIEMKSASRMSWVVAGLVGVGVVLVGLVVVSWQRQKQGEVGKRPSSPRRPARQ